MNGQNHTATPSLNLIRAARALALAAICMLVIPIALQAQRVAVDRATETIIADEGIIQKIIDAAKEKGIPVSPSGGLQIPVEIIRTLALNAIYDEIATWIKNSQLCNLFDKWATGKNPGASGTLTIEYVLVKSGEKPSATSPRITVKMFVKKSADGGERAGKGGGSGYIAPMGPDGKPMMRMDLFGDGKYILEGINCLPHR